MATEKQRKRIEKRRSKIISFINEYRAENGYAPSVRDIQEGLCIKSTATVYEDMKALSERGDICFTKGQTRSISAPGDAFIKAAAEIEKHCRKLKCNNCTFSEDGKCNLIIKIDKARRNK